MGYPVLWPHALIMIVLGAIALRPLTVGRVSVLIGIIMLASVALTVLYRIIGRGPAAPIHEDIGSAGWCALILTAAVPLIAVAGTAAIVARLPSPGARGIILVAIGLCALLAYPLYGLLLYCGLTRVCP